MTDKAGLPWLIPFTMALALITTVSCDESLPPRNDPSGLFGLRMQPIYVYSESSNYFLIHISLTNNFDETLSDTVRFDGTLIATSQRDASVHKTFSFSQADLVHGTYDPGSGMLTINPGDSIVVSFTWLLNDDAGRDLPSTFFHYHIDTACSSRLVSDPERFSMISKTRLFAPLGYTESASVIQITHFNFWVSPKDCQPL